MDYLEKLIGDIECHSVEGIRTCFQNGINPNAIFRGKPLIYELITEYGRGKRFSECVKQFIEFGLIMDDKMLLAVLSNDDELLESELQFNPDFINKKYSFDCAFTQLHEATLMHLCAEYNHVSCAKILMKYGADINEKAGVDEYGFGGQTPIFHTVNQHAGAGLDMMNFLLENKADLGITVTGILWGKGYPWETFIPCVNPISYAMMGLLPQFQRSEQQISEVVSILLKAGYGIEYKASNIPNSYLQNE